MSWHRDNAQSGVAELYFVALGDVSAQWLSLHTFGDTEYHCLRGEVADEFLVVAVCTRQYTVLGGSPGVAELVVEVQVRIEQIFYFQSVVVDELFQLSTLGIVQTTAVYDSGFECLVVYDKSVLHKRIENKVFYTKHLFGLLFLFFGKSTNYFLNAINEKICGEKLKIFMFFISLPHVLIEHLRIILPIRYVRRYLACGLSFGQSSM